jgi:galactose mutarotase-like enzyme
MGQQYQLENKQFKINILKQGAQLCKFINKLNNEDVLWNGNPDFWAKHSPILFPNIGKIKNDFYSINTQTFQLPKHGFVKDVEWDLVNIDTDSITLKTCSTSKTLEIFPFDFELIVSFILSAKGLKVEHLVKNTGLTNLYFSIGAHPAFKIPFHPNSNLNDYDLHFEKNEICNELNLTPDGFLLNTQNNLLNQNSTIPLNEDLFYQDTVIIPDLQSRKLIVKHQKINEKQLVFSWHNFNYLAIWKPKNAPFICLEPWQGLPDYNQHDGNWLNKKGNDCLLPNEFKMYTWEIEIIE